MFGAFGAQIAAFACRLWIKSLRVRVNTPEGYGPGIIGVWHRDLLACGAAFKGQGLHVLVSESGDGEIFARTLAHLGYTVSRGSDTHGSQNVRHLVGTLWSGGYAGMALDGPRGPAHQVKPGSPWLSRISGRPLWLVTVRYGAHFTLKTWDNFVVPLPLSSIDMEIKYFCNEQKNEKEMQP